MKAKVKLVAVGACEKCGREFVRPFPCDAAVCNCESATLVPLETVLVMPESLYKKYEQIASLAEVSVEDLVNAVLEVGLKEKMKEIKHA